jgi:hypothetical protein
VREDSTEAQKSQIIKDLRLISAEIAFSYTQANTFNRRAPREGRQRSRPLRTYNFSKCRKKCASLGGSIEAIR